MCGFVGIFQPLGIRYGPVDIGRMAEQLAHRGPDDSGFWGSPRGDCLLGFRRLAIIDLSAAGHQPMLSADGRWTLCFNGEIYNHAALRTAVEQTRGQQTWRGSSDSESLVEALATWGPAATLPRLDGMFAFAAYDHVTQKIYLARDRFGEKPLYVGRDRDILVFGSELSALRQLNPTLWRVSPEALESYLTFGYLPGKASILAGIERVSPATFWEVQHHAGEITVAEKSYWSFAPVTRERAVSLEEATSACETILQRSVEERLVADVPVGLFLSGGVDSSVIVALAAKSGHKLKTFSIGFEESDYDESRHAVAIAAHFGCTHRTVLFRAPELLETLDRYLRHYDEPFADSSALPLMKLSQEASSDVKVVLSGDGGDELFGGYDRYFLASKAWQRLGGVPASLRTALSKIVRTPGTRFYDRIIPSAFSRRYLRSELPGDRIFKLTDILRCRSAADFYQPFIWSPGVAAKTRRQQSTSYLAESFHETRSRFDFMKSAADFDRRHYLPEDILVKLDRATMAASIEGRAPFLDHQLWEYLGGLPPEYRFHPSNPKILLKRILGQYLPPGLWRRQKHGFSVPVGQWARGGLRDWFIAGLDRVKSDTGDAELSHSLTRMHAEHMAHRRDWSFALWKFSILGHWLERHNLHLPA